jgi:hypothetical protein
MIKMTTPANTKSETVNKSRSRLRLNMRPHCNKVLTI